MSKNKHQVGEEFEDREALSLAGVHTPREAGIWLNKDGITSIIVSNSYEDDEDLGDVILYTGDGGRDRTSGKQTADQQLTGKNKSLALKCLSGEPIRVTRAIQPGPDRKSLRKGPFRYDGYYFVTDFVQKRGRSGFIICQFRLERDPLSMSGDRGTLHESDPEWDFDLGPRPLPRFIPRTKAGQKTLSHHRSVCQICGGAAPTIAGGFCDPAYIVSPSDQKPGPDDPSNILCLCPNCYVGFMHGDIVVHDDWTVTSRSDKSLRLTLRIHQQHNIDRDLLAQHRARFLPTP